MNGTYEKISSRIDLDIHCDALGGFREAATASRGMKTGKAPPPWGIPSEIWKVILDPNKVFRKQMDGIGHIDRFSVPTKTWKFRIGTLSAQKQNKKGPHAGQVLHVLLNYKKVVWTY